MFRLVDFGMNTISLVGVERFLVRVDDCVFYRMVNAQEFDVRYSLSGLAQPYSIRFISAKI